MQISPINSYQNRQNFQSGVLQIGGQKPIPYAKLGTVGYAFKQDRKGRQVIVITLTDTAGEVLQKFKRMIWDEAFEIVERLQLAKKLTRDADKGDSPVIFAKVILPKTQLSKKELISIEPRLRKSPHAILANRIGNVLVQNHGGLNGTFTVEVFSKKRLGNKLLWSCTETCQSLASTIAENISRAVRKRKATAKPGKAFVNPEEIAKSARLFYKLSDMPKPTLLVANA